MKPINTKPEFEIPKYLKSTEVTSQKAIANQNININIKTV